MRNAKRSIQATITINGVALVWRLHRDQQWSAADGWRGVAIHVSVADLVRRELHLEYPAVKTQKNTGSKFAPARPGISSAMVEAHVRQAIAAGWDPESRGKPFVYEVPVELN